MTAAARGRILGVDVDLLDWRSLATAAERLLEQARLGRYSTILYANPETLVAAQVDSKLHLALASADLVLADSVGISLAARLLGFKVPVRMGGTEPFVRLLTLAEQGGYLVYFLGATAEVNAKVVARASREHPQLRMAGAHHGHLPCSELDRLLAQIASAAPDLIFLALGCPRQERLALAMSGRLSGAVVMAVGGTFDFYSGSISRAPTWMTGAGLEWFYRLLRQPSRLRRQLALPLFCWLVLRQRWRQA